MNAIEMLVTMERIREAYGAHLEFKGAKSPIVYTLPDAGAQTGELMRCFALEVLSWTGEQGIIEGRKFTLQLEEPSWVEDPQAWRNYWATHRRPE